MIRSAFTSLHWDLATSYGRSTRSTHRGASTSRNAGKAYDSRRASRSRTHDQRNTSRSATDDALGIMRSRADDTRGASRSGGAHVRASEHLTLPNTSNTSLRNSTFHLLALHCYTRNTCRRRRVCAPTHTGPNTDPSSDRPRPWRSPRSPERDGEASAIEILEEPIDGRGRWPRTDGLTPRRQALRSTPDAKHA